MTNEHQDTLDGILAQAVHHLMRTPHTSQPPADLDCMILEDIAGEESSTESSLSPKAPSPSRTPPMFSTIKYFLAASILISAGMAGWFGTAMSSPSVYGEVAKRVQKLQSVIYRTKWIEENSPTETSHDASERVLHLSPSHSRIERPNGSVLIIDADTEQAIELNIAQKTALILDKGVVSMLANNSREPIRLIETLQNHFRADVDRSADVQSIGSKKIGGVQTQGLRSKLGNETIEAWIDPSDSLPVEIRISLSLPSHLTENAKPGVRMWRVLSDLEFDTEIDRSLFSVEVPEGYSKTEMPSIPVVKDKSATPSGSLIELLRLCAEHNESYFPDSLSVIKDNPGTCMGIMKRYAKSIEANFEQATESEKDAMMDSVVKFGSAIGRVTPFLFSMRPENKLQYAGAKVKLNTPNKPILWYSPNADDQFQVIYADLTLQTVNESELPAPPETRQQ